MIIRVRSVLMFLVAAVFLIVTACSGQSPNPKTTQPLTPSEKEHVKTPAIDKPTKLVVYHQWGMTTEGFMNLYGKYVTKKYPNLSFEVIGTSAGSLEQLVASNTNVDFIFHTELNLNSMISFGISTDLSDLIKTYKYDMEKWDPSVTKYMREFNDGKIPAIPLSLQTLAFYYNKDLFSKFGVPFPKDNMTWDDVRDMSLKLTRNDAGTMYWGYDTQNVGTKMLVNPLSMPIVDPKTDRSAFETDRWKNYITQMITPARIAGVTPAEGSKLDMFIKGQRLAMTSTMNSNFTMFAHSPGLNWDVANYPTLKEAPGVGPQPEIVMLYIPSTSKNREAAFLAAAELSSPEVQRELSMDGQQSVLRDSAIRDVFGARLSELNGKNAKALVPAKLAEKMPYSKYVTIGSGALTTAYNEVADGKKDINTALRDAAEVTNKKIEEQKSMTGK
ncbi:ABC transporter substrate-binding protein [Paenibacillus sp. GCM10012303]|uniref:ABC transporter substrate-binding protein n=1 Tax=Paenibacillus sp. GCM10012303 TaxID=3317340 RepID=UPI00361566A7